MDHGPPSDPVDLDPCFDAVYPDIPTGAAGEYRTENGTPGYKRQLKTTLVSVGLIFLLGTPLAYLMGRHQFRYKKALDALIDLPLVLPPSVAGLALLITLGGEVRSEAG